MSLSSSAWNRPGTYPHFYQERTKETTGTVITRDMSKCIRCLRCVTVLQGDPGTDVLVYAEKGLSAEIGVRDSIALGTSSCVSCGQCTLVCPVGALAVKDDTEKVLDFLYDPKITTVFQIAPAVRVALGEEFRMKPGTPVIGKIVTRAEAYGRELRFGYGIHRRPGDHGGGKRASREDTERGETSPSDLLLPRVD
jgi:ferredoxin hydrogenase gamma subunit